MGFDLTRRQALTGIIGGTAIAVGLPLLDAFLDGNGETLTATGAPVPVRFGTWFWALGVNPDRWFPSRPGPGYELKAELEAIRALKDKINVFGNFSVPLDGAPHLPHASGAYAIRTGRALTGERGLPGETFDATIGKRISMGTRLPSLGTSASGNPRNYLSGHGITDRDPPEVSAAALYARIFGTGSRASTPDALAMARQSVLSAVADQRQALERAAGAADRQKLDRYFTSLRRIETRLDAETATPASTAIEHVMENHELMTDLLVIALASDQTRVVEMTFNNSAPSLTRLGSTVTHHQLTHEEALDKRLGYQPEATNFLMNAMEAWSYFVFALDGVKEGDRTLLDNMLVFAHSDTESARLHTIDNIPMMTAGSAGGKLRTGIHVDGRGTPVSRVGLTLQQVMGLSLDSWGAGSLETGGTIGEIVA